MIRAAPVGRNAERGDRETGLRPQDEHAVTRIARQAHNHCPSEAIRSELYSALITNTARPMAREDFECETCGREYFACECNSLPSYAGADPSLYNRESNNGR